jgi:hypothetical protein
MRAAERRLTVGLLLASYLLATVGVSLHQAHECSGPPGLGGRPLGSHHCAASPVARGVHACASPRVSDAPGNACLEHRHDSEQCLLCRFSWIKKSVAYVPDLAAATDCLPERVAVTLPAWRVAEAAATPDSRAPPCEA